MAVAEQFGRQLRVGMIGGGPGSFIGETHRIALRVDGLWNLVGGSFSRNLERSQQMGRQLLLDPDRIYADYRQLIEAEGRRQDRMDAVVVATTPETHFEIASALMEAGFAVICEKPMTVSSAQAQTLCELSQSSRRDLLLTHCYSGYPMVRLAREMAASGELGRITMIDAEFASGAYAGLTPEDEVPWRLREAETGGQGMLADVGTHAFQLAQFVSGDTISQVSAWLSKVGAVESTVADTAFIDVQYASGAVGRIRCTYQAAGATHGLRITVYGTQGSLAWDHETAEVLWHRPVAEPDRLLTKGGDPVSASALESCRFSAGHPDGYGLAFANLYRDFALLLMSDQLGVDSSELRSTLPDAATGLQTLRIVDAVMESSTRDGQWITIGSSDVANSSDATPDGKATR